MKKANGIAALLCGAALIVPAAAWAQDSAGTEGGESNEIIVTATREARSLQSVPMTVNVATGEQLQKFNIFDAKDVQQLAPGLELSNTSGRNNTTTLRGVTFDPDQGTSPAVQVYYNEIPTDAQTVYTALYDIQQIEVLRGPQGLLRGLSAPAGSITIATRRPNFDEIEGYAQATATTRDGYNIQAGVSLPFNDTLAIRVAGLVDGNRLNNVRNITNGERSRSRTESARVTLGWQPSSDFTAYLTYQYLFADNFQNQQVVGTGAVADGFNRSGPALEADDYAAVSDGRFRNRNESHIVNLAFDYDLGPATLSFVGAHQFSRLTAERDLDAGNAIPDYVYASTVRSPYKVDSAEVRLASNNKEGFGWGVGAFYTKQTGTVVTNQRADQFFAPVPIVFGAYLPVNTDVFTPVDTQTWSFNGNLRYRSNGFSIEGGLRYSIIKNVQTTDIFVSSPGNAAFGVPPFTLPVQEGVPADLQRFTNKPLTGGVTVSYEFNPRLNAYFAYGHSYRAGSTGVAVPLGVSRDLIRTKPEKTDSFEVGLKGKLFDNRANFTVSAFYQTLENYLSRFTGIYYESAAANPPTGGFDFNYNGDAKIKGVEASIDGRITDNWDLGVSASYVRARYDNALVPCNDYAGTGSPNQNAPSPAVTGPGNVSYCVTNGRLAQTPDFNLTANTEIRFSVGEVTPFVRALLNYRPGFYADRVDYDYRSRTLLNLFAGFRTEGDRFELTAFAKNVLNQKRITNISLGTTQFNTAVPGLTYNSGYQTVNVTNPREFGLTGTFRF
ncbi:MULTISPECIES: TonB-dependent receptor [Sphingobium]|uniref:TonB-dependent receptor n=1 Tax=Sphingobium tyrosinilyticum TaxID=2715436 RepID=A0ABV9F0X2_9SPHN|nr:TonB-dependent receptor [Sphingobium sp. EP60837]ANI80054.1 Pesticin receptor [Sphingobium sp. EP60837]